jgi:uncharacterized membrane protein (DUF373 family)
MVRNISVPNDQATKEVLATAPSPSIRPPQDDTPQYISRIMPKLRQISHFIILLLIVALLVTIVIKLYMLFAVDITSGDFQSIINDLLLLLILIELLTILYSYLVKHYIKVERVIELGIISIIREMLFRIETFDANKIYAVAVLLISFGALFFVEKYWSKTRNQ